MAFSNTPSSVTSLALTGLLSACHAEVHELKDTTVQFAVEKLLASCAQVRKSAQQQLGDPNATLISVVPTNSTKSTTRESCACIVASCEYVKNRKVESTCNGDQLCATDETTVGEFIHFDQGDDGVLSKVTFAQHASNGGDAMTSTKIEVQALVQKRNFMREGTCTLSSAYQNDSIQPKPREYPSQNMRDCLAVEIPVAKALEDFIK